MNSIIDEIFNKIFECKNMDSDSYIFTTKKAYELEKALLSEFNEEQRARLKECMDLYMQMNLIESKYSFRCGCEFTLKFIFELLK